jgi:UDP-N-acetylmuramoyl-L-alanyl-D-glutamate--2,6-diaminopimelate ligase
MKLKNLLESVAVSQIIGDEHVDVKGVQSDSRKVASGFLFVAVKGSAADGHEYITKAISLGASVIVCEYLPENIDTSCVFVQVSDSTDALGLIASKWNDTPSEKLILVGVTGTNGKTTIATLLYDMFRKMGHKVGLLSTVCNYIDDEPIPATHTTPDPIELNALLAKMVQSGCEYAFMEVSSHAVDQKRISGLSFNGGVFTNLTRDHLDYHKTVEAYLKAKKTFFDHLPSSAFAVTNADDKVGLVMLQNTKAKKYTYSLRTLADFKGKILESHIDGTELVINGRELMVHFVGKFNVYNLLAVYGAAICLGKDPEECLIVLSNLHSVSGRFETIPSPLGYTAIVDYAHTPDAITNVLNGIKEVICSTGKIISVVGAGGNRDKGKRPLMAKEAVKLSDQLILTADNPRFEDPALIIEDMKAGLSAEDLQRTLCITDRSQAIKTATMLAVAGDVILVAGKGHEDYQDIQGVKIHFDDREQLREIFILQKK